MKIALRWILSVSLLCTATYASTTWWITPSRKVCIKNGGNLAKGGICQANWYDAKRICRLYGDRLPTINELRRSIIGCGGVVDNTIYNRNNSSYQHCYQRMGFSASHRYWSATTYESYRSYAWVVHFYYGYDDGFGNRSRFSVRCIRIKE